MTKRVKILLGIATLWPLVGMGLYFLLIVAFILFGTSRGPEIGEPPLVFFFALIGLQMLTFLWMLGLMVIYTVHLFKTDRVPKDQKALWAVVLFLGNMLAMPVYWYLYIWREPNERTEPAQPDTG